MKYLSGKKTVAILASAFVFYFVLWALPSYLESLLLQKIVFAAFCVWGFLLALFFFIANGGEWSVKDGEYEKEYYSQLASGKAKDEGENLRPNPLKLSLAKRIYYSKIALSLLFPLILIFAFEYVVMLLDRFFGGVKF